MLADLVSNLMYKSGVWIFSVNNFLWPIKVGLIGTLIIINFKEIFNFIEERVSFMIAFGASISIYLYISYSSLSVFDFLYNLKFLLKLLMPIVLYVVIQKIKFEDLFWYYFIVVFIGALNLLLMVLGFIFSIELFQSYSGQRFGFDGFFLWSNDGTFFYIIGLLYCFVSDRFKVYRWLVLAIGCLLGTKSYYLSVVVLMLVLLIQNKGNRLLIISLGLLIPVLGMILLRDFFSPIFEKYGFWVGLTSNRSFLFMEAVKEIIENWTFLNYLFGTLSYFQYEVESDPLDIIIVFGLINSFFIFILYYYTIIPLRIRNPPSYIFLVVVFNSIVAGHALANSIAMFAWVGLVRLWDEQRMFS